MRPYVLAFGIWLITLNAARAQPELEPPSPGGSPTEGFVLSNAGAGIPENGALLFEGPYDSPLTTVTVRVTGTLDVLSGELTAIADSRFWVWQPAQPLPLGTLSAETSSTDGVVTAFVSEFQVVPAIELGLPELMFAPSASLVSVVSSKKCCRVQIGSAMLVDTTHCFGVESDASVRVDPGVFTSTGQLHANQYLFRFSTGANQRTTFTTGSFRSVVLPVIREQADEYCFGVSAIELPTLRELTYDGPATCAAHGELAALGKQTIELGTADLSRGLCRAPPAGYEDAWCEVNDDCSADYATCALYPHFCEGEPLEPVAPDAGDGDGDGDGDEASPAPMANGSGGGCSVAMERPAASGAGPIGLLGALIALVRVRRRRGQSGPGCATPTRPGAPEIPASLRFNREF